jgi:uncharacterized protein (DUF1778 family)
MCIQLDQELKFSRQGVSPMAPSSAKPPSSIPPTAPAASASEAYRTKSIAARLTEAEFAEVESAAVSAGQKVSEWLRSAALAQAHREREAQTDPILLAEILGVRDLVLNLFAKASEGPIDQDDLRKISKYADAIKQQKAEEVLRRTRRNDAGSSED